MPYDLGQLHSLVPHKSQAAKLQFFFAGNKIIKSRSLDVIIFTFFVTYFPINCTFMKPKSWSIIICQMSEGEKTEASYEVRGVKNIGFQRGKMQEPGLNKVNNSIRFFVIIY